MINGIIFQERGNLKYQGVEGNNWYLNDIYPEQIGAFFAEHIEKSWYDEEYVDVASDLSFINLYINLSKRSGIEFRMLLCETERTLPQLGQKKWEQKFIGYDYAYSGGSYYSAVLNDICSQRINEMNSIKLNKYGLFENIEELKHFIAKRKELYESNLDIEEGDFIIYKLYEIVN